MIEKIAPKQEPPSNTHERVREVYCLRIKELKEYALEDDIEVNPASEQDFYYFVYSTSMTNESAVFLTDSGNYRAVWKDDNGGHVGIQFFGKQQVECVIFKRRAANDFVSRIAGHDTLEGVKRQIRAFDLDALVGV